jgi:hypothetical protein
MLLALSLRHIVARFSSARGFAIALSGLLGAASLAAAPWIPLPPDAQNRAGPPLRRGIVEPESAKPPAGPAALVNLPLSGDTARLWNASLETEVRARAARPFVIEPSDVENRGRALSCLTSAIYYEAGAESLAGQRAVAQVVLNRLRHPSFPKTVCGVVFEGAERATGCQFTFTCDGSLARTPTAAGWRRAKAVAEDALDGFVDREVGHATHYHAVYVVPYWSPGLLKVANVGAHIFYQRPGQGGEPGAFNGRYAGGESIAPTGSGSVAAPLFTPAPAPPVGLAPVEPLEMATVIAVSDVAAPVETAAPAVELARTPAPDIFRSQIAPDIERTRLALPADGG